MSNTLEYWLCMANQKQLPKEKDFEDAPSNKIDSWNRKLLQSQSKSCHPGIVQKWFAEICPTLLNTGCAWQTKNNCPKKKLLKMRLRIKKTHETGSFCKVKANISIFYKGSTMVGQFGQRGVNWTLRNDCLSKDIQTHPWGLLNAPGVVHHQYTYYMCHFKAHLKINSDDQLVSFTTTYLLAEQINVWTADMDISIQQGLEQAVVVIWS